MSYSPSRSLRSRLLIVLLAGLLTGGLLLSASAMADTAPGTQGRVSGLVLNRSNQPLAGATITLTGPSGTTAGATDADGQGRWSLAVPQGDYDLAVTAQQDGHVVSAKVLQYTVGADTKLNLVVAGDPNERRIGATGAGDDIDPGTAGDSLATFTRTAASAQSSGEMVTFSGRVLDADGNPVVSGVTIWLNQPQTYFYRDTRVAEDGSFSLEVWPDDYTLTMYTGLPEEDDDCYGCAPERSPARIHAYQVENVRLDGDRQEAIRLPRPSHLSVTVVDPGNRPVAGAWVSNMSNSGHPPPIADLLFPGAATKVFTTVEQVTGADGAVDLEYIPGAAPHSISVEPPPGTTLPSVTPFPANASIVTIRLQDGPTLYGRVIRTDGTRLGVTSSDAYLMDDSGRRYPFAFGRDGFAVTAPEGSYRMFLGVSHNEEGESSDYRLWSLQSQPFDLTGDRELDLAVPLGYARMWVVDDHGKKYDFDDEGLETGSELTIADGIRATAYTTTEGSGGNMHLPVIGPSHANGFDLDYDGAPHRAYVAPGEDTIIAFIAGTGPGDDDLPPTTTTTTSQPTTTTTKPPATTTTTRPVVTPDAGASTATAGSAKSGYWALASDGTVYEFGDAPGLGHTLTGAVDLEPTPTGKGYWTLNRSGVVSNFGDAMRLGDVEMAKLARDEHPASLSATPSGKGYWIFTDRGRVLAFGDAPHLGDMAAVKLNGPVLGSVATPSGKGYYMVASDGGIFAFGDAGFAGSMGGRKLNAPVQSLVPDTDGKGYWLVASDGGIFAFDAPFRGSMGDRKLNKPISGMVRYGDGYLMVGADGGIFNFSNSPFAGSLGDTPPASPVVAVAARP